MKEKTARRFIKRNWFKICAIRTFGGYKGCPPSFEKRVEKCIKVVLGA